MYRDLFFYEYSERPLRRLDDGDIENDPHERYPQQCNRGSNDAEYILQGRDGYGRRDEQKARGDASGQEAILKERVREQGLCQASQGKRRGKDVRAETNEEQGARLLYRHTIRKESPVEGEEKHRCYRSYPQREHLHFVIQD